MNKAWKRLMMVAVCAALGTVWAGAARASFDFFAPTVTSDGTGGFDYSYFLVFNNGGTTMPPLPSQYQLHTNDFATLYDVASENSITVYNSASAPATDISVSSALTGATPVGVSPTDLGSVSNYTFTYTGNTTSTSTYWEVVIDSAVGTPVMSDYAGEDHYNSGSTKSTFAPINVPGAGASDPPVTPLPSALTSGAMMGGLLLTLGVFRKRAKLGF